MFNNCNEYVDQQLCLVRTSDIDAWLEHVSGITVIHCNIRSIRANWNQLLLILRNNIDNVDIIVLTEISFLLHNESYSIDGFNSFSKARSFRRGGGIYLFVRNSLKFKDFCVDFESFENICGSISLPNDNQLFLSLICVYRPPSCDKGMFIRELDTYIGGIHVKSNVLLIGDMNLDLLNVNDSNSAGYRDLLVSNGFHCCIDGATREEITNNILSSTCIDHCFLRLGGNCGVINSLIYETKLTDHYIIGIDIPHGRSSMSSEVISPPVTYYHEQQLSRQLKEADWERTTIDEGDVDLLYETLHKIFQRNYEKCSALRSEPHKKSRPHKKWMTNELLTMIKERDSLFKRWKNCSNLLKQIYKCDYQRFRNLVNKEICKSKELYYKQELEKCHQNVSGTWNVIHEILGKPRKASADEVIGKYLGKIYTNEIIVNTFSDTFIQEVDNILHSCDIRTASSSYLTPENQSMRMPTITKTDVRYIIDVLDVRKQPGYDGIRVRDLKNVVDKVSPIIAELINLSLKSGKVPEGLKISIVKPIYKKGDHLSYTNYRPISLLPSIEKILERCVAINLNNYLSKYNIINKYQYGFQKGKSTSDLLLSFSDFVNSKLNDNLHVLALFIDYSKAFDTLNHKKLAYALDMAGIRGPLLQWFVNYLSDRKFTIRVGNASSAVKSVRTGVPQGSILGPILYLIYVNSLFGSILKCKIYMYADDTLLVAVHRKLSTANKYMQEDFTRVLKWSHDNDLIINSSKTKIMHICSPFNVLVDAPFSVIFHSLSCLHLNKENEIICCQCSDEIEPVESHVYLGVLLDRYFTWKPHIDNLCNRLRACSFHLYQLKFILPFPLLRTVYCALGESLLLYGLLTWGCATHGHLQRITSIQNYMLKIIMPVYVNHDNSINFIYQYCNFLPFMQLFTFRTMLRYYFCEEFRKKIEHSKNTRLQKRITYYTPNYINKYGKRQISILVPSILNLFPDDLKKLENYAQVKREVKNWLFLNV